MSSRLIKTISLALVIIFISTYFVNNFFVGKYLTYKNRLILEKAYDEIYTLTYDTYLKNKTAIQEKYDITCINFDYENNEVYFNEELRRLLSKEKINLNKIWLAEEGRYNLEKKRKIKREYNQKKLGSYFSALFFMKADKVIVIGKVIPHFQQAIQTTYEINFFMWNIMFLILLIFIYLYMKKITKPIQVLKETSTKIAHLNFEKAEVKTGDELEELSDNINVMSEKLNHAIMEINTKNNNLKTLISDISHEIKTPIASINLYAHGLQDNMDDGTYIAGIIQRSNEVSNLLTSLLEYSKINMTVNTLEEINMYDFITDIIDYYKIMLTENNKRIQIKKQNDLIIHADKNQMETVMKNLVFNGIKYSSDEDITMLLDTNNFTIMNHVAVPLLEDQIKNLTEPFYVVDKSRSGKTSGSGLGLSIIKDILNKHDFTFDITCEQYTYIFKIYFDV